MFGSLVYSFAIAADLAAASNGALSSARRVIRPRATALLPFTRADVIEIRGLATALTISTGIAQVAGTSSSNLTCILLTIITRPIVLAPCRLK